MQTVTINGQELWVILDYAQIVYQQKDQVLGEDGVLVQFGETDTVGQRFCTLYVLDPGQTLSGGQMVEFDHRGKKWHGYVSSTESAEGATYTVIKAKQKSE